MRVKIRRPVGVAVDTTDVTDSTTRHNLHHEVKKARLPITIPEGYEVAMIRDGASIKLSLDYQSAGVDVGVDMPWPVRPGHPKDLQRGIAVVEAITERRLAKRVAEVRKIVRGLSRNR